MNLKHRNIFIILRLEFQNTVFSLNAIRSFWRCRYKEKRMKSVVLMPRIFVITLPIMVSVNIFKILGIAGKNGKDMIGCSRMKTVKRSS